MKKLSINLVSESVFTVQGHGVHTAFLEMKHLLENRDDVSLSINDQTKRKVDITHLHTFGFFAMRRMLSRSSGKIVISAHVVPDSLVGSIAGAKIWIKLFQYYLRWFYNRADLVIAVSPYTREKLLKLGVKRPITVLPNSIDIKQYKNSPTERKRCRERLGLPLDKFIIVGNGQIQPRKCFDTFLKVAEKMPDVQFVWIGGIPFKAAGADYVHLSSLIKKAPSNVIVTDVIPLNQAQIYMKAGDLMFMPSNQETFGLAILEGAACGMPVIVRDINDYKATFGDLVISSNEDNFIDTIRRYMVDDDLYKQGQAKSRQLAHKYDSSNISDQLIDLYRNLINQ